MGCNNSKRFTLSFRTRSLRTLLLVSDRAPRAERKASGGSRDTALGETDRFYLRAVPPPMFETFHSTNLNNSTKTTELALNSNSTVGEPPRPRRS